MHELNINDLQLVSGGNPLLLMYVTGVAAGLMVQTAMGFASTVTDNGGPSAADWAAGAGYIG